MSPYAALVSGVIGISTGAIFARLAQAPSLVIAAYRVGLAAAMLFPVTLLLYRKELFSLKRGDLAQLAAAGFFLALHFAAWIASLSCTTVANSVVLVNTNPLWVGLLAPVVAKERIHRLAKLGIILSLAGVMVLAVGDFSSGEQALKGDLLAVAGGFCAAVYILFGRRLRRRLSLMVYVTLCYGSAALFLWAGVLATGSPAAGYTSQTWIYFWAMAIIPQIIGHTSYNWALRWLSASMIAVSLLGEPVGSSLLAYLIFGERPGMSTLSGGVLILVAIYITASGENKTNGYGGQDEL